ncbi:Short-chain-fatty-acid-CoA ligase, partial [human gut metagenome]
IAGYSSGAHRLPTRLLSRSLSRHCVQAARAMPDKIAVVDNHGASYTYSAIDHAASCLANWMLAEGVTGIEPVTSS